MSVYASNMLVNASNIVRIHCFSLAPLEAHAQAKGAKQQEALETSQAPTVGLRSLSRSGHCTNCTVCRTYASLSRLGDTWRPVFFFFFEIFRDDVRWLVSKGNRTNMDEQDELGIPIPMYTIVCWCSRHYIAIACMPKLRLLSTQATIARQRCRRNDSTVVRCTMKSAGWLQRHGGHEQEIVVTILGATNRRIAMSNEKDFETFEATFWKPC